MDFITNPIILGAVVIVLVWLIRQANWKSDGVKALWLTMLVSIGMALIGALLAGELPNVLTCSLTPETEPISAITCVLEIAKNVIAAAAIVFTGAQIIYQALRRGLAGNPVPVLGVRL